MDSVQIFSESIDCKYVERKEDGTEYQQGITFRDVGYSSAIAMIYTIFMSVIALTLRKVMDVKD